MTTILSRCPTAPDPDTAPDAGVPGTQESQRSRWHWRDWPVVVKLATVLLVPTIVALVSGVLRIVDQAAVAPGYIRISQIAAAEQHLADLVGALTRERGLAAVYVVTGRTGDRRELDEQLRTVDGDSRALAGAAGQVRGLEFTRAPLAALGALAPLRASVTTGFSPADVIVTEYNAVIDPLIDLDAALTRQLDDNAVTNAAAAAHDLLAAREQVSRQHAIVAAALYANRLTPGQIEDLRTAAVRLATDRDAVRATLPPADRVDALTGAGSDAEQSRQRVLTLVLNRGTAGQPLSTSPADWDRRTAVVVNNIAVVEKGLRGQIDKTAQRLLQQARTEAGLNSIILFFALAIGVLIGILVARALLTSLGVLKRTALDVADRRLPEAMARIRDGEDPGALIQPVPVSTREEIGQVARAFDEVHSQAVRLASEQATLRANVNEIFVSLSRRTQSLVERQLKLIDRLESGEQDPQQLDNLFQLDHLATRMRRNSENLLVLAGTDATNRSGRPVRLIDVLRAAVSEVEQYQRLVLQQPPAVLVLGRTANDLVHLLSELLDNATQFSPPDSHVMVSSECVDSGAVTIEVADRGVGMNGAELAEANTRLSSPAAVDASVSRRMGLFVVGRLASRHGIDVCLRHGEGGVGICASVTVPALLVRAAVERADLSDAVNGSPRGIYTEERVAGAVAAVAAPAIESAENAPTGESASSEDNDRSSAELPEQQVDEQRQRPTPPDPAGGLGRARRNGNRPGLVTPPAVPLGPLPSGPPRTPAGRPGSDMFRAGQPGASGTPNGSTLQNSTPIFDDVASAWFKEREAVPVGWADKVPDKAPKESGEAPKKPPVRPAQPPNTPSPDAPLPDAPPADDPPAGPSAPQALPATAGAPALIRRQPGKTLSRPPGLPALKTSPAPPTPKPSSTPTAGSAPKVDPTIKAGSERAADAAGSEWGAGDEGWRAAQALTQPVKTEITAVGLPRRQPRALLVPGAAGETSAPSAAPSRSAESVRGRLASYQQGIREGRQARANVVADMTEPASEPKDEEQTT